MVRLTLVGTVLVLGLLLVGGGQALAGDEKDGAGFTSSKVCGRCHQEIYQSWRGSMHALAVNNRVFQEVYKKVYADTGGQAKFLCLRCHSPTALITKDYDLKLPLSREGVTCDFCHSVGRVSFSDNQARYHLALGEAKRGPKGTGRSPAHKVRQSKVHTRAEFCAPCHQGLNSSGLPMRSTYQEWQESDYAEAGKGCQGCHMGAVKGEKVSFRWVKGNSGSFRNHKVALSLAKVKAAAQVKIRKVERLKQGMNLSVEVINSKAGHMMPTGTPLKKVVLTVRVELDNGQSYEEVREYGTTVVDDTAKIIGDLSTLWLDGKRMVKDSRLAPGEKRVERFSFAVPKSRQAKVKAILNYAFAPSPHKEFSIKVALNEDTLISHGKR